MYPRYKYSKNYGSSLFENVMMIERCPGQWEFTYKINRYGYRGEPVRLSNNYDKNNIVILGDSYSFGQGVNDGDEYPAIMAEMLRTEYNVINLSVGGWALSQEIRKYYEFGQLYFPKIVLLQFCGNDPDENFLNRVTSVQNGKFIFLDSEYKINWLKKFLSNSVIQKSQIYNLLRNSAYNFFAQKRKKRSKTLYKKESKVQTNVPVDEKLYVELLEVFADDLHRKKINLIIISVNGHLDKFLYIKNKVIELNMTGKIDYYEVIPWFENVKKFSSPEGHFWDKKAHKIIGEKLSKIIFENY